ncbi:hypothetical protein RNJ44_03938 [Nakaseomyces bracarensis]|uniref:Essential protein Yae1 N-terminal domain-containing protein n=1 Tax=Nakaseomyces bracarensis TaxID=273131 RepID=A0ABR4NYD4_9SACH
MDVDELLFLEEQYYAEGFQEGRNENLKNNLLEGKEFGLQVGFQRFVLLGQMLGLCDVLESMGLQNKSIAKNIATVRELISTVQFNNEEENVEGLEKTLVKLKNKYRLILLAFQREYKTKDRKPLNFDVFEDLARAITGEIKGYVEDEDVTEQKNTQDQAQAW